MPGEPPTKRAALADSLLEFPIRGEAVRRRPVAKVYGVQLANFSLALRVLQWNEAVDW